MLLMEVVDRGQLFSTSWHFLGLCFVPNYQKRNMTEGGRCTDEDWRKSKGLIVTLYEVESICLCFNQYKPIPSTVKMV